MSNKIKLIKKLKTNTTDELISVLNKHKGKSLSITGLLSCFVFEENGTIIIDTEDLREED